MRVFNIPAPEHPLVSVINLDTMKRHPITRKISNHQLPARLEAILEAPAQRPPVCRRSSRLQRGVLKFQ